MKRAALALAAIVALTAGGFQPGLDHDRLKDMAIVDTDANMAVTDATPMFAVRIDDGIDDLVNDGDGRGLYWDFLVQRIPTSIAVQYDKLDTPGFAKKVDLVRIQAEYDSAGVKLEWCSHNDGQISGSGDFGLTYDQLVDALNPSELESLLGRDIRYFAANGDGPIRTFWLREKSLIISVLDSLGYDYADLDYESADSSQVLGWTPHVQFEALVNPPYNTLAKSSLSPGRNTERLNMPAAVTLDHGNYQFERSGWTLQQRGVTPSASGNWNKTWRFVYSYLIANGWGAVFAVHDSAAGDEKYPGTGEFSPAHMAFTLRQLADDGFIRLGTVSEVSRWATSDYAVGTDLIAENGSQVPCFAIADTVGVEFGWVAGLGSYNSNGATWSATQTFIATAADGFGAKFDHGAADFPPNVTGTSRTSAFGYGGGVSLDGNTAQVYLIRTMLPEGRYRLSIGMPRDQVQLRRLQSVLAGKYERPGNRYKLGFSAYGDTIFTTWYKSTSETLDRQIGSGANPSMFEFDFTVDGRVADDLLGWASTTAKSSYAATYWLGQWYGGLHVALGVVATMNLGPWSLTYLGPTQ